MEVGVLLVVTTRVYLQNYATPALTLVVLVAITWHLVQYEKGRREAGLEFTITVAGVLYLGWIGAYLVELRHLPDGLWWFFLVLPSVWLADSFAYFVGVRFGKHLLSPRLSPKKTWEGYWGGVFFGTLGTMGIGLLMTSLGGPIIPWWKGLILGAVLSSLTTLGDLGESMLKRYAGVKDSGTILPGHGGALDRIDSWLWGGALGYQLILWFFI
jgi:phosphatidate cytidylyltransferase